MTESRASGRAERPSVSTCGSHVAAASSASTLSMRSHSCAVVYTVRMLASVSLSLSGPAVGTDGAWRDAARGAAATLSWCVLRKSKWPARPADMIAPSFAPAPVRFWPGCAFYSRVGSGALLRIDLLAPEIAALFPLPLHRHAHVIAGRAWAARRGRPNPPGCPLRHWAGCFDESGGFVMTIF